MKREFIMYSELIEIGIADKHSHLTCKVFDTKISKAQNFIYVLTGYFPDYDMPLVKIGVSKRVISRYEFLQKDCQYPVFLDYVLEPIGAGESTEILLHKRFEASRVENKTIHSGSTEWFCGVTSIEVSKAYEDIRKDYYKRHGLDLNVKYQEFDYSKHFKPNLDKYFDNHKVNAEILWRWASNDK